MNQEQEVAKAIAAILNRGSLDQGTASRLAAAREKAVAAMPAKPAEQPLLAVIGNYWAFHMHGQRLWVSVAGLLGAVLVAMALMQLSQNREPIGADASLLAADLPPEAYLDKGFDAWLEQSSRHSR